MEAQMEQDLERMSEQEAAEEEAQPARRGRRAVNPHTIPTMREVVAAGTPTLRARTSEGFVYDVCFRPLQLPSASAGRTAVFLEMTTTLPTASVGMQNAGSSLKPYVVPVTMVNGERVASVQVGAVVGSFVVRVYTTAPLREARLRMGGVAFMGVTPAPCRVFPAPASSDPETTIPHGEMDTSSPLTGTTQQWTGSAPPTTVPQWGRHPGGFLGQLLFAPPLFVACMALLLLLLVLRCCCRPHHNNHNNNNQRAQAVAAAPRPAEPVAAPQMFAHPPPALALYSAPPAGYAPVAAYPQPIAVYPRY
jgi:hypothetical protein